MAKVRFFLMVTAISTVVVSLLSGCGPSSTPASRPGEGKGNVLVGCLSAEMEHLNPLTATDAYASYINGQIFDTLIERDPQTLEPIPNLAESWEISEDHLQYTFTLRRGVVFSDGQPLTVNDVKLSFDKMMDPTTDAPHLRNYYKDVTSCEVLDENTVRFTCNQPYFLHLIILGGLPVMPAHVYGKGDFNTHPNNRQPVGSGPYMLERWDTNQQVVLVKNPHYWGAVVGKTPQIEKRVYKIITDANAAFQVLNRGDMDYMELRPEDFVKRADTPKFNVRFEKYTYLKPRYAYIGWNSKRPQFADKRVRRALTMLLDRQLIIKEIYYDLAQIMTGNFMPDTPEYNPAIQPWPFDPKAAQALLTEAGWEDSDGDGVRDKDGVAMRFEVLLPNASIDGEKVLTIYQEELKRAGIDMQIRQLEWATMLESVTARTFDAVLMAWSLTPEPDPYQVWHTSQIESGSNYVGFGDAESDALIETARRSFDRQERIALYHRFQEIIHEEQPYTFVFTRKTLLAVDKRVKNVKMYPFGPEALEWRIE